MSLLVFIKTKVSSVYKIHPPFPWNNLDQLRIRFSYLKHKFRHDIEDTAIVCTTSPFCWGGGREGGGGGVEPPTKFSKLGT